MKLLYAVIQVHRNAKNTYIDRSCHLEPVLPAKHEKKPVAYTHTKPKIRKRISELLYNWTAYKWLIEIFDMCLQVISTKMYTIFCVKISRKSNPLYVGVLLNFITFIMIYELTFKIFFYFLG